MDVVFARGDITYADGVALYLPLEIPKNVLAGTGCDLKVFLVAKMLIGVEKSVANVRCPNDRRNAFGQIKTARLIVEVVPPASARISLGFVLDQPLECSPRFITPGFITGYVFEPHETAGDIAHPFRGSARGNSEQWPHVQRETAYSLLKDGPKQFRFKR